MARKATSSTAPAKTTAAAAKTATAKRKAAGTTKAAKKAPATKAAKATAGKAAAAKAPAPKAKAPAPKKAAKRAAPARKAAKKAAPARTAAKARPRKARSPFSAAFLSAQREALLEERATYLGQAEALQAEADSLVADVDPGDVQFDEESGEGDTLAVERERDLALSAQARQAVEEIDHALAKLDEGTYGLCEVDQEPIAEERLEAIPWARTCVEHKVGGFGRR